MWPRLPQSGCPVHEVRPDEEAEREGGGQRLRKHRQTSDQRVLPWGLSAEELAVQRLVTGKAHGRILVYMLGRHLKNIGFNKIKSDDLVLS